VIDTEADVEIDLLSVGDAIAAARVEQVAASANERELSHVLSEQNARSPNWRSITR
jgi:hypothetical protein